MRELLDYWLRHPDAQGTVETIVEWWLLEHRIERAVADVSAALTELVAEGLVCRREQGDGHTYYALNRERQQEIAALLLGR